MEEPNKTGFFGFCVDHAMVQFVTDPTGHATNTTFLLDIALCSDDSMLDIEPRTDGDEAPICNY